MHVRTRYGVKFVASTPAALKNCQRKYYALPAYKRKGIKLVTPSGMFYGYAISLAKVK